MRRILIEYMMVTCIKLESVGRNTDEVIAWSCFLFRASQNNKGPATSRGTFVVLGFYTYFTSNENF